MKVLFDDGAFATFPDDSQVFQNEPFYGWFRIRTEGSTDAWLNGAFVKAVVPDKLEVEY